MLSESSVRMCELRSLMHLFRACHMASWLLPMWLHGKSVFAYTFF